MMPLVSSRSAHDDAQYLNDEAGCPPTAPLLTIAMIGISARPVGGSPLMLHETVAVREAVHGRFCCKSLLKAVLLSDSVAVTRFAAGAEHDGAVQARAGKIGRAHG